MFLFSIRFSGLLADRFVLRMIAIALPVACPYLFAVPVHGLSLFEGYDENLNGGTTGSVLPRSNRLNTTKAFENFKANLGGVGVTTESYEMTKAGTDIDGLQQTLSGVNATYSYRKKSDGSSAGTGNTASVQKANATTGMTNSGTYPTDGVQGISINSANTFKINFASPLAAFSFWGTDLGDSKNSLTVILRSLGQVVAQKPINYLGANAGKSSVFFFGGIAQTPTEYFDEVELLSSIPSTGDAIGLDQLTVGTPVQVAPTDPTAVPTPALLPGLVGLALGLRRKVQGQSQA